MIHVQDMTKIPLCNKLNKAMAVLTLTHDKTNKIHLLKLFEIYKNCYNKHIDCRKHFCKYIKIDVFFTELPSLAEIAFLLYAKDYDTREEVSKNMCRGLKTIETHITHINSKLHKGTVTDVVHTIRIASGSSSPQQIEAV